jgi:hypothetical protein
LRIHYEWEAGDVTQSKEAGLAANFHFMQRFLRCNRMRWQINSSGFWTGMFARSKQVFSVNAKEPAIRPAGVSSGLVREMQLRHNS